MPRTIETIVYTFDELSDKAKQKAREWFLGEGWEFDSECTLDNFADIAEKLGYDLRQKKVRLMSGKEVYKPSIYFSGFSSQGDGACFEGDWHAFKVEHGKLAEEGFTDETLLGIAKRIEALAKRLPKSYAVIKHSGRYSHSGCTDFDFNDGVDDNEAEDQDAAYDSNHAWELASKEFKEVSRDLMNYFYKTLEGDYYWQISDEVVDENIRANKYEFTADGKRARV